MMIGARDYIDFVRNLDDDALALQIGDRRETLAKFDTGYAELRALGSAPSDEMVETSIRTRSELRLAEHELARRSKQPYGVYDNGEDLAGSVNSDVAEGD